MDINVVLEEVQALTEINALVNLKISILDEAELKKINPNGNGTFHYNFYTNSCTIYTKKPTTSDDILKTANRIKQIFGLK